MKDTTATAKRKREKPVRDEDVKRLVDAVRKFCQKEAWRADIAEMQEALERLA